MNRQRRNREIHVYRFFRCHGDPPKRLSLCVTAQQTFQRAKIIECSLGCCVECSMREFCTEPVYPAAAGCCSADSKLMKTWILATFSKPYLALFYFFVICGFRSAEKKEKKLNSNFGERELDRRKSGDCRMG